MMCFKIQFKILISYHKYNKIIWNISGVKFSTFLITYLLDTEDREQSNNKLHSISLCFYNDFLMTFLNIFLILVINLKEY